MKRTLIAISLTSLLAAGSATAVSVSLANTGAAGTRPVGNPDSSPVPFNTGSIRLGTVTDPVAFDALAMGLSGDPTRANANSVLSTFTAFASGNFSGVAGDPPSLFDFATPPVAVAPASALDGAPVYFVVTNGPNVDGSDGLLIYKTDGTLPNDSDPTAAFDFRLAADSGSALFGVTNGNVDFSGTMIPGVLMGRLIPEPSVSLLAFASIGILVFRRRR